LNNGYYSFANGKYGYTLYRKSDNYIKGFDVKKNESCSNCGGYHFPLIRLTDKKELSNKEIFLLFLEKKLKPNNFKSKAYDLLFKNINLDKNGIEVIGLDIFTRIPITKEYNQLITKNLLKADKIRANLIEYDKKLIEDVNKGSWEAFSLSKIENFNEPFEIELSKPIVAKNPKDSIVKGGVIGIDFGTKSTVVVYQKDSETVLPLRVGIGDWSKKQEPHHYENPTVMEFIDLDSFLEQYHKGTFRPKTKWDDVTISHTAYENLKNSNSKEFNAYLTELKQWAGDRNRKLKIEDKKSHIYELKEFEELQESDLNPIELYAYYLGLYINNQHSESIYLEYLLSFPVTYDLKIREKILNSFKRGLAKSLPDIGAEVNNLKVTSGVSEPAAYAAIALQEYELAEENEKNFYGIFDFGGGTTDFDFGIFRWSDEDKKEERRYDYVIEHFGAGGDKYLGGENLLELLAFEVFKRNSEVLRENKCSFELPPECREFLGSELLLSDSREARLNMVNLINKLRPFWEREEFEDNPIFEDSTIKVDLYDNSGELKLQVELEIDENELYTILENRIKKGVDSFFESLAKSFYSYYNEIELDIDTINIFLAGNSSKSPIVKKLFDEKILEWQKEFDENGVNAEIVIYQPLDNRDDFSKPNGKTGVAFGLIETRSGGTILVVDRNIKDDNIKFSYYLGRNRRRKFKVIIDRDTNYNEWFEFIDASDDFEIYYTDSPLAIKNNLSIKDSSIKKLRLSVPNKDAEKNIYIRLIDSNSFEYGIGENSDNIEIIKEIKL
jgi:hypothetical protein